MDRRGFMAQCSTMGIAGSLIGITGCGTLMHRDRVGQYHSRDIDWKVAALDGLGLAFFFVPGVIAFAVDFYTGAIYLPPESELPDPEIPGYGEQHGQRGRPEGAEPPGSSVAQSMDIQVPGNAAGHSPFHPASHGGGWQAQAEASQNGVAQLGVNQHLPAASVAQPMDIQIPGAAAGQNQFHPSTQGGSNWHGQPLPGAAGMPAGGVNSGWSVPQNSGQLQQIPGNRTSLNVRSIERAVSQRIGTPVRLESKGVRVSRMDGLGRFAALRRKHSEDGCFGAPVRQFIGRFLGHRIG